MMILSWVQIFLMFALYITGIIALIFLIKFARKAIAALDCYIKEKNPVQAAPTCTPEVTVQTSEDEASDTTSNN